MDRFYKSLWKVNRVLTVGMLFSLIALAFVQAQQIENLEAVLEDRATISYAFEDSLLSALEEGGASRDEAYSIVNKVRKLAPLTRGYDGFDGNHMLSVARTAVRVPESRVVAVLKP